jgi:hypothetical protein
MRTRQLIIWPPDDRLANLLRSAAKSGGWTLRTPRTQVACLRTLGRGGRSVLVLGLSPGCEREFAILDQVSSRYVRTDVIVIAPAPVASLTPLAWRLGAALVMTDPWSVNEIVDIATGLLGHVAKPFTSEPSGRP